jgi:hypothetical protein
MEVIIADLTHVKVKGRGTCYEGNLGLIGSVHFDEDADMMTCRYGAPRKLRGTLADYTFFGSIHVERVRRQDSTLGKSEFPVPGGVTISVTAARSCPDKPQTAAIPARWVGFHGEYFMVPIEDADLLQWTGADHLNADSRCALRGEFCTHRVAVGFNP